MLARRALRFSRPLQRMCHHVTERDRQISMLYRELGDYQLRDSQYHQYYFLLERIRHLESELENMSNPDTQENE